MAASHSACVVRAERSQSVAAPVAKVASLPALAATAANAGAAKLISVRSAREASWMSAATSLKTLACSRKRHQQLALEGFFLAARIALASCKTQCFAMERSG